MRWARVPIRRNDFPAMAFALKLNDVEKVALLLATLALAGILLEIAAFWRGIGHARRLAKAGR
ncbi:MAG: hypothetical protein M3Z95_00815, partial [Actinomycetota bacterium]|nr:hypothetical protein [Actinomycetota bacterium]